MKQVVDYVTATHGYGRRKACRLTRQHRSTQRKPLRTDSLTERCQRMDEIVATQIRFGYRRVDVMLKREGWQVDQNVVYRLYREEACVCGRYGSAGARWRFIGRPAVSHPGRTKPKAWILFMTNHRMVIISAY